jgi:N-hydroxyarylamine O-acetyltransferase
MFVPNPPLEGVIPHNQSVRPPGVRASAENGVSNARRPTVGRVPTREAGTVLRPKTTEAVLDRLGFSVAPAADKAGLDAVYLAWCRRVPFDNVIKRIHMTSGAAGPLPNGEPEAFFALYLEHSTGGTCWPSSGALFALLESLGFDATRRSAAMRDDVLGPIHTHGTIIVRLDGERYWVDTSMLTDRVVPLSSGLEDPIHQVRVEPVDDRWRVHWIHPWKDEKVPCLLLDPDVTQQHYLDRYEWSREFSPFNTFLSATVNTPTSRLSASAGARRERTAASVTNEPYGDHRDELLIEAFGYSEEIVSQLPPDDPFP